MGGERTLAQLSIYPSTAEYRDIHQGGLYRQYASPLDGEAQALVANHYTTNLVPVDQRDSSRSLTAVRRTSTVVTPVEVATIE